MKISDLVKQFNKFKKEYGDIEVVFNNLSVNPEYDSDYSQNEITIKGAFYISDHESCKSQKCLVLESDSGEEQPHYGNTPAKKVKK